MAASPVPQAVGSLPRNTRSFGLGYCWPLRWK
jgi:hypothetical protein